MPRSVQVYLPTIATCHHAAMNTAPATSSTVPTVTQPRGVERIVAGQATSDGAGVKLTT